MSRAAAVFFAWVACFAPLGAGAQPGPSAAEGRPAEPGEPEGPMAPEETLPDPDSQVTEAQSAYERGIEAARAERWPDALAEFERAYQLHPDANLLVNLATAQAHLGRLVDALDTYKRALREIPEEDVQLRQVTLGGIRQLEPRIPEVRLELAGLEETDVVLLDEDAIDDVTTPHVMDPGRHELRVERRREALARRAFDLAEGEHRTVRLVVEPPPRETALLETTAEPSFYEAPWFWATALGLVAIAVAAVVIVAVTNDGQEGPGPTVVTMPFEPFDGTLNPGTLRLP